MVFGGLAGVGFVGVPFVGPEVTTGEVHSGRVVGICDVYGVGPDVAG